jgi:sperm-associated antigen 1
MSQQKPKYNIEKISFEWVEECKDRKEIKKAYEAIKADGGYYDLEQALKNKLASLDPSFNRRINEKPLTKEEKENIDTEMDMFLRNANEDDESLLGKHSKNIFSNPKEEAAERIGKRKQAENERLKGNDLMKSRDYELAIECYNKSLELDPNEASTYSNRALAYINRKQYSKAIEDANKSIELDPEYIKAYYRRGKAYESTQKYELAIKDYEFILEKEPKNLKIKKELLTLRAAYKEHSDKGGENKKFRKIKIEEAESSPKVEEIVENKPIKVECSNPDPAG